VVVWVCVVKGQPKGIGETSTVGGGEEKTGFRGLLEGFGSWEWKKMIPEGENRKIFIVRQDNTHE
jgi:hypothetical protein